MKRPTISVVTSLAIALFATVSVAGADVSCSIHPPRGAAPSVLQAIALITEVDARATALAAFPANSAEIIEAEIEAERGCLVYSFDVRLSGKDGVEEVWIDAGTGQLLARRHEALQHEALESAVEKSDSN